MQYTNRHNISLPLAVWLLHDDYDYISKPKTISATTIMQPLKVIILKKRINWAEYQMDLSELIAPRLGSSIHAGIERAWVMYSNEALKALGYPPRIYENIVVNPTPEQIAANPQIIPVWFEQRRAKEIAGWTVTGKLDTLMLGQLYDYKSTSVYSLIFGSKDGEYAMQGGIYRWLQPDMITEPNINIQFVFTDWKKSEAARGGSYPPTRLLEKSIPMVDTHEVQKYLTQKLLLLDRLMDAPEEDLPECTDEELWRSETNYKYYQSGNTAGRATRVSTNRAELVAFQAEKKGVGTIVEIPGEVKRCSYCAAYNICKQKDRYIV